MTTTIEVEYNDPSWTPEGIARLVEQRINAWRWPHAVKDLRKPVKVRIASEEHANERA